MNTTILRAAVAATQWRGIYQDARAKMRRVAIAAVCSAVGAVFVLAGLLWADAALWFYYAPRLGAPTACLIAAGALLAAAIVMGLIAISVTSSRPAARPPVPPPNPLGALPDLSQLMHDHKGTLLIAAALAGLLLSNKRK